PPGVWAHRSPRQLASDVADVLEGKFEGGIPKFAEGGIVTKPTVAMLAEKGEPEVVTPVSKLPALAQAVYAQDPVTRLRALEQTEGLKDAVAPLTLSAAISQIPQVSWLTNVPAMYTAALHHDTPQFTRRLMN